jgi:protein gp37
MAEMGSYSSIGWTNATWNPVVGCSAVSEGCRFCYAETLDKRWRETQEGVPYKPWTHPNAGYNVRTFPDRLELPLRWKEPRMVFVNSRSDVFHEAIPAEFRKLMWSVMRDAKRHTFQILTKRPENIAGMLPPDWGDGYPNVWLGVSGETLDLARERGAYLFRTPAVVHFLSAEPWLEQIVLSEKHPRETLNYYVASIALYDWVILGGESGPHCRPFDLDSARLVRDACAATGTPFFLKQLGGSPNKRSHELAVLDGNRHEEFPETRAIAVGP